MRLCWSDVFIRLLVWLVGWVLFALVRCGRVWFELVLFGLDWFGCVLVCLLGVVFWSGLVGFGLLIWFVWWCLFVCVFGWLAWMFGVVWFGSIVWLVCLVWRVCSRVCVVCWWNMVCFCLRGSCVR